MRNGALSGHIKEKSRMYFSVIIRDMEMKHLAKSPIVEAILQITCIDEIDFNSIAKEVKNISQSKDISESSYKIENGRPTNISGRLLGKQLKINSNDIALTIQRNSFALSQLKPYKDWQHFSKTFKSYYEEHIESSNHRVSSISTRFINKLELDGPLSNLKEYLNLIPLGHGEFETIVPNRYSLQMAYKIKGQTEAKISIHISNNDDLAKLSVIIDLDVISPINLNSRFTIEPELKKLRDFKNKIFFDLITEKAAEYYSNSSMS